MKLPSNNNVLTQCCDQKQQYDSFVIVIKY